MLWCCKAEELGHLPLLQGWHFGYAQAQEVRPWVATVQAVAESLHLRSDRLTLIELHKQASNLPELVFDPVDKIRGG